MGDKESKERLYKEKKRAVKGKGKGKQQQQTKKRLPCENGRHRDSEFPCQKANCQSTLCANCAPDPTAANELFCSLCRLSAQNLDFEFDEDELADFNAGGMIKQQASVKFDRNSSKVTGWDSIWSLLEAEEKEKSDMLM